MCLDRVTECDVVLKKDKKDKKDKKVWKVVFLGDEGEYSALYFSSLNKHTIEEDYLTTIHTMNLNGESYDSGYHCFTSKKDALAWKVTIGEPSYKVLPYIIPAGTTVTKGIQDGLKAIVSPVLINPRVKE